MTIKHWNTHFKGNVDHFDMLEIESECGCRINIEPLLYHKHPIGLGGYMKYGMYDFILCENHMEEFKLISDKVKDKTGANERVKKQEKEIKE